MNLMIALYYAPFEMWIRKKARELHMQITFFFLIKTLNRLKYWVVGIGYGMELYGKWTFSINVEFLWAEMV